MVNGLVLGSSISDASVRIASLSARLVCKGLASNGIVMAHHKPTAPSTVNATSTRLRCRCNKVSAVAPPGSATSLWAGLPANT